MQGVTDSFRMELLNAGKLSATKLRDARESYLEILDLKLALRDEFWDQWLPSIGLDMDKMAKLQDVFVDFESRRKSYNPYLGQSANTSWLVSWPESAVKAAEVIQDMVYGTNWDSRFRDAVRSKHKVQEFWGYESVQQALTGS